ncbi:AraC family transcriptional regulator [Limibacter armeniacum]|uniref:AraC family transcriptional regulator n=1 Tax=Limibacter armeniacum TaxID=466084 RepID=UPI002FE59DBF
MMNTDNVIHIKNMVCPRCIMAVEQVLNQLKIPFTHIELGAITLAHAPTDTDRKRLGEALEPLGFALLESTKSVLISRIKTLIIDYVHHDDTDPMKVNLSTYLADNLHHDYSYLSRLFSSVEGITIEKYITSQKIERVKELLFYDELTLSEIAFKLHYSSVAHLSSQFKKETGMTPTAFRQMKKPDHKPLDKL